MPGWTRVAVAVAWTNTSKPIVWTDADVMRMMEKAM